MAIENYGVGLFECTVNGALLEDWGNTDPAFNADPIDQQSTLLRGIGGNAVRLDDLNPGKRVTLNLKPGGKASAVMQGLLNSGANITLTYSQIGTLESAIGSEGVLVNTGPTGRAGRSSITDDQFIIEFNVWTETKGG